MTTPELAIIIPTLNEAMTLQALLDDLATQQKVVFELLIVDGGSVDDTVDRAEAVLASRSWPGQVLACEAGRGRQLNRGVARSRADWLLFLHADSRLSHVTQLREALDLLIAQAALSPDQTLAGHFPLHFDLSESDYSLGYYYYETKARLSRPDCVHGDQGFLLHRHVYAACGPFREDLAVMEDTWFANAVSNVGRWVLLPAQITTSPRRFLSEGLAERQTLNALLMNFLSVGWYDFLQKVPGIYRVQTETGRLDLSPFFAAVQLLLSRLPLASRWRIWLATGDYVCGQIWQLGLYLDCRYNFAHGLSPGAGTVVWMGRVDRWIMPLVHHRFGAVCTALLVRVWFVWKRLALQRGSKGEV